MKKNAAAGRLRVAFLHPDLGIGGSERLVVDAALELEARGHGVRIYTARHDPGRCLAETLGGRLDIRVRGGFIPPGFRNRLRVPCSLSRMAVLSLAMRLGDFAPDVIVCDLVPHVLPLLQLVTRVPIVYYCHYPDLLLAPGRRGLYRWYRLPVDWMERVSLLMADRTLVNSRFTAGVFRATFPKTRRVYPEVVYPGVDVGQFRARDRKGALALTGCGAGAFLVLSLNRFDPHKNLPLALEAFARLRQLVPPETFEQVRLVMAGGYDERLPESRRTFAGLVELAERLGLSAKVVFLRSVNDAARLSLLTGCDCLLYTSTDEHFGIGVVEGMAAGLPVVAVNRGGPLETLVDGVTGFLTDPEPECFARALAGIVADSAMAGRMGKAGRERAAGFSRGAFGARLDAILRLVVGAGVDD